MTATAGYLIRGLVPDPSLPELQFEVRRTRAALRGELDGGSRQPFLVNAARERARVALERFVVGLVQRSLPVPRKIHAELDLLRRMCAPHRRPPE